MADVTPPRITADEAAQLRKNERPNDPGHHSSEAERILGECADVANFAMMIADVCARGMRIANIDGMRAILAAVGEAK